MGKKAKKVISFVVFLGIMVTMFPSPVNNTIIARGNNEKYISEINIEATSASNWSDEGKYNSIFYSNIKESYKDNYNTEATALEIHNAEELAAFSRFVNTPSEGAEPEHSFEGKFVKLMSNIDLNGTVPKISESKPDSNKKVTITISNPDNKQSGLENAWIPIGLYNDNALKLTRPFKGHFDGNNKKVSNMVVLVDSGMISETGKVEIGVGLFGVTNSAEIKNVSVEGNSFVISKASVGSKVAFRICSGGIVGKLEGSAKISNCSTKGVHIYSSSLYFDDTGMGSSYLGGIVGTVTKNLNSTENASSIENSSSQGGIICFSGKADESHVGGVVGYAMDVNISDCYSNSEIYTYSAKTAFSGGLAGQLEVLKTPIPTMKNCYSTSNVYSVGEFSLETGGLIGRVNGNLQASYSTGDVYARSNKLIKAGGLIGAYMGTNTESLVVKNYSSSNVYAVVQTDTSQYTAVVPTVKTTLYCGGLIGHANRLNAIRDNYSLGDTYSSSTGNIYSGGLIGALFGSAKAESNYSAGRILASSTEVEEGSKAYTGGISGYSAGTLSNNFYNTEANGIKLAVGMEGATSSQDGNLGLTTMEMTGKGSGRASENMKNFSSDTWEFNEDSVDLQRYYYPSLPDVSADLPYYTVIRPDSVDIKAWQTSLEDYYQVRVTWGQMTFVYDKGKYDSNSMEIKRKTTDEEYSGVEAGADDGMPNKWYGFDGTNNKVKIENLSTVPINSTAVVSSDITADIIGETSVQLYFKSGAPEGSLDSKWLCNSEVSRIPSNLEKVSHATEGEKMRTFGKGEGLFCEIPGKAFKEDGTESDPSNAANSGEFFLNITGQPGDNFSSNNSSLDTIGKITVNFTK